MFLHTSMDLPQWFVELMNDNSQVVFPSKCYNTVVSSECSILSQTGEVSIKTDVVFHEGFEVVSMLSHVADHLGAVEEMIIGVAVQLITQSSEQTVSITRNLFESESNCAQLGVQTGIVVKLIAHTLLLLLVPPVCCSYLPFNSFLGHDTLFMLGLGHF